MAVSSRLSIAALVALMLLQPRGCKRNRLKPGSKRMLTNEFGGLGYIRSLIILNVLEISIYPEVWKKKAQSVPWPL